nr:hypothetical protein [uncultured bacterium]
MFGSSDSGVFYASGKFPLQQNMINIKVSCCVQIGVNAI